MNKICSLIILFVFLSTLFSCKSEAKVVLPFDEEKVVALLADMHFAKSASLIHIKENRDSMKLIYESQVCTIHDVSKDQYQELMLLLESDLNLYYEIEQKVHEYLKTVQNEKI